MFFSSEWMRTNWCYQWPTITSQNTNVQCKTSIGMTLGHLDFSSRFFLPSFLNMYFFSYFIINKFFCRSVLAMITINETVRLLVLRITYANWMNSYYYLILVMMRWSAFNFKIESQHLGTLCKTDLKGRKRAPLVQFHFEC